MPEITRCGQCGQSDDHPKIHFAEARSVHFDCMSVEELETATGAAQDEGSGPKHSAVAEAARAGVHGDDLRAAIQGQGKRKLRQAEGLHHRAALAAEEEK